MVRHGAVLRGRQGAARLGKARLGKAGQGRQGGLRHVGVRHRWLRRGIALTVKKERRNMTAYRWKRGAFVCGDAQLVGSICEGLERKGELTPSKLVDVSRSDDAPLHSMFEWNDEEAAEKYREQQARLIINSVEVVIEGATEPVKAFVSLRVGGTERRYERTEIALKDTRSREMVLREALSELRAFERKYNTLSELADVLAAIRSVA